MVHQSRKKIFKIESNRDPVFAGLVAELKKIHSNLNFRLGPRWPQRELTITANGMRAVFPAVSELVSAAPELPRWKIVAFCPRVANPKPIEFLGKPLDPQDVQFSLVENADSLGVMLFIPKDDPDLKQMARSLLYQTLGEYDWGATLNFTAFVPASAPRDIARFPLSELPAQFDKHVATRRDPEYRVKWQQMMEDYRQRSLRSLEARLAQRKPPLIQ